MDDRNLLHLMFEKGDKLRPKYNDFDFSQLEAYQIKSLQRLSFFSKHKKRILKRISGRNVTREVKVIFLD